MTRTKELQLVVEQHSSTLTMTNDENIKPQEHSNKHLFDMVVVPEKSILLETSDHNP